MKQLKFIFSLLLVLLFNAGTLHAQSITVVSPNGGENWPCFTSQNVQWMFTGMPPTVNILLSTDNMVTWTTVATSIASGSMGGSHSITVPYANSNKCFIRVEDSTNPSIKDESNGSFSIIPPTITITTPNGGETWNIGTSYDITWSTTGMINTVDIYESRDNGATWNLIIGNTPSGVGGGSYSWLVGGMSSTQCKVRVNDFMHPMVGDTSNATFTIMTPMNIHNSLFAQPVKVYPNPISDYTVIEIPSGSYALTVADLMGRTIIRSQVNVVGDIITINFADLSEGSYILRLESPSGKIYQQKITKF